MSRRLGLVLDRSTSVRSVDEVAAKRISVAVRKIGTYTHERDDAIVQAHFAGASLREIAGNAGMTHTGVKKLLERHLQALQQAAEKAEEAKG